MFSVIMPVYNGAAFIEKAILSIENQSFDKWELIIVNDGSTDDTKEILKKYDNNEKIRVINQENAGAAAARNTGIKFASFEHIAFLDADDEWYPNHLEKLNEMITKYPTAGLYATFVKIHTVSGDEITTCNFLKDKPNIIYVEDFLGAYREDKSAKMFNMVTTCVKKNAFIMAGGFTVGSKIGEDLELVLKIAAYYPFVLSGEITGAYHRENSTATRDCSFDPDWSFFESVEEIYKDEKVPKAKKENLRAVMNWFTMRRSRHYLIGGERKKAVKSFSNIDYKSISKKDYFITALLLVMPGKIVRKIFSVRWRAQG